MSAVEYSIIVEFEIGDPVQHTSVVVDLNITLPVMLLMSLVSTFYSLNSEFVICDISLLSNISSNLYVVSVF